MMYPISRHPFSYACIAQFKNDIRVYLQHIYCTNVYISDSFNSNLIGLFITSITGLIYTVLSIHLIYNRYCAHNSRPDEPQTLLNFVVKNTGDNCMIYM